MRDDASELRRIVVALHRVRFPAPGLRGRRSKQLGTVGQTDKDDIKCRELQGLEQKYTKQGNMDGGVHIGEAGAIGRTQQMQVYYNKTRYGLRCSRPRRHPACL